MIKNHDVYTARSININFESDPQVKKSWARLI